MAEAVIMPKLGLQMTYGKITKWYVKEGDTVEKDMPLFAIETDKLTVDVESTATGVVLKIVAQEGDEVEIIKPCCYVGKPEEAISEEVQEIGQVKSPTADMKQDVIAYQENSRVKITPAAKKAALEYGIDYGQIKGTGPNGRIQKEDIFNAVSGNIDADDILVKPMSAMRKTIARRLTESKQTVPHVYFQKEIDATGMLTARDMFAKAMARKNGNKLTINDMVLKAVIQTLSEFEDVNAQTDGENITYFKNVNLGLAVSILNGLIVPVIKKGQEKSIAQISKEAFLLAQKARAGKLMPDEYTGGTFTVSNLGGLGLDSFQAIINPPEAGILAVGTIKKKAVVIEDEIVIRPIMMIVGSFDHRLVDGAVAARFMARVSELLEDATQLFI